MEKRFSLKTVIAVVCFFTVAAVAVTTALFTFVIVPMREGELYGYNNKMLEINELVDKYYVGEIDEQLMSDSLFYGYTLGLDDQYAGYITESDANESMNSLMGYNTGIGIQASLHPDTGNIYVAEVHKDSPAENGGLEKGDQIVSLDGQIITEIGYAAAINYIPTVPIGKNIAVSVLRNGMEYDFEITLSQFMTQTVFYEKIEEIGYISITSFNDKTVEQFKTAVDDLVAQEVTALIFDVRGNGGGTLNSVYQMVDYLVPEGLITKVDYKIDGMDETYMSDAHEIDIPMAVLTDENSASASELFTQSLLDYGKAITVGRKTYGKGVVQRTFTLSDGSLIRFTVAKYYTKNGICVDGIGVEPTVVVEWDDSEISRRIINGIEVDKDFLTAVEYFENQAS